LELFAAKEPLWQEIVMLSQRLAMEYLDRDTAADTEFGNNTVILAQLLQYLEVCHAMKHGNIGRVEAMFMAVGLCIQVCW